MRYLFLLISVFSLLFVVPAHSQPVENYGLSVSIQQRIIAEEGDYVRMVRQQAPEFRLVRSAEVSPPIAVRTMDVPIVLRAQGLETINRQNSPPLIATLHDRRTGRPLDNCIAPCVLKSPRIPPGMVTLYRYGSEPVNVGAETYAFTEEVVPVFLGFNEVDHVIERERCAADFEVIRRQESTRDAEPCVRIPPRMPDLATESGHCYVVFNVSPRGEPTDVRADECTSQVFCERTTKAARRWIYYPKLQYGEAVEQLEVRPIMRFALTNSMGQIIPEPTGDMLPCVGSV